MAAASVAGSKDTATEIFLAAASVAHRKDATIENFLAAAALHYLAGVVSAYHFPPLHLQQFYQDKIYMIGVQKWSYD